MTHSPSDNLEQTIVELHFLEIVHSFGYKEIALTKNYTIGINSDEFEEILRKNDGRRSIEQNEKFIYFRHPRNKFQVYWYTASNEVNGKEAYDSSWFERLITVADDSTQPALNNP